MKIIKNLLIISLVVTVIGFTMVYSANFVKHSLEWWAFVTFNSCFATFILSFTKEDENN